METIEIKIHDNTRQAISQFVRDIQIKYPYMLMLKNSLSTLNNHPPELYKILDDMMKCFNKEQIIMNLLKSQNYATKLELNKESHKEIYKTVEAEFNRYEFTAKDIISRIETSPISDSLKPEIKTEILKAIQKIHLVSMFEDFINDIGSDLIKKLKDSQKQTILMTINANEIIKITAHEIEVISDIICATIVVYGNIYSSELIQVGINCIAKRIQGTKNLDNIINEIKTAVQTNELTDDIKALITQKKKEYQDNLNSYKILQPDKIDTIEEYIKKSNALCILNSEIKPKWQLKRQNIRRSIIKGMK